MFNQNMAHKHPCMQQCRNLAHGGETPKVCPDPLLSNCSQFSEDKIAEVGVLKVKSGGEKILPFMIIL